MKIKISDMMDSLPDDTVSIRERNDISVQRIQSLTMAKISKPYRRPRYILRNMIAACLMVFLLAIPVSAEVRTGYVSNLLAPLYGMAQTELVDSIGIPLGAETTVNGYTLAANAVIGDRYNVAVVYSLTRADGGEIDPWLRFEDSPMENSLPYQMGGSGGGYTSYRRSPDGKTLFIVEQWRSNVRFLPKRTVKVVYQDLMHFVPGDDNDTLVAQGQWELNFTVRYEDTTQKLPVRGLTVADRDGNEFELKQLLLSPIGIHIDMTGPNYFQDETDTMPPEGLFPEFEVSLLLKDGTVIELPDHGCGGHASCGKPTMKADWGAMFDFPIPMEDIQAVNICGTLVPVTLK